MTISAKEYTPLNIFFGTPDQQILPTHNQPKELTIF